MSRNHHPDLFLLVAHSFQLLLPLMGVDFAPLSLSTAGHIWVSLLSTLRSCT